LLESLRLAEDFLALRPARVTHAALNFSKYHRRFRLPEAAWGLSRYALDHFLLRSACERGVELRRERYAGIDEPLIYAAGRSVAQPKSRGRIFGFKAHFSAGTGGAPAGDAVELFFFSGGYAGLCPIEQGKINLCGLAKESLLGKHGFNPDRLLATTPRLAERVRPLERTTRWHVAGPLRFGHTDKTASSSLSAGDASCFVDPFTGSGVLAAVQTGIWAATAALRAARAEDWAVCCKSHRRECASFYRRQLATTGIMRTLLSLGWAEPLAGLIPGRLLFHLTRPQV